MVGRDGESKWIDDRWECHHPFYLFHALSDQSLLDFGVTVWQHNWREQNY